MLLWNGTDHGRLLLRKKPQDGTRLSQNERRRSRINSLLTLPANPRGPVSSTNRSNIEDIADFSRGTNGLLPVIAQDATNHRVLMMAWMDRAALEETVQTGQAVYYSRSRKQLWRKGETSGHRQTVREIRVDCDRDTILLMVDQIGAACHEGYESCFFRKVSDEEQALEIADPRLVDPDTVYQK